MKRNTVIIAAALLAAGGMLAYHFAGAGDVTPAQEKTETAGPATLNFPPAFPPAPATPSAPGNPDQATAPPAAPSPPPPPAPVPAPIAKALAAARAQAPSRAMSQLAKDWFGCATEDGYNTTLSMIQQKSPGTGDHFHGPDADCAPLPTGTRISVMRLGGNGIAQISLNDTHKVYWTDTEALAGDPKQ